MFFRFFIVCTTELLNTYVIVEFIITNKILYQQKCRLIDRVLGKDSIITGYLTVFILSENNLIKFQQIINCRRCGRNC